MKRFLLTIAILFGMAGFADACPKLGHRLFKGHIRTAVHNVVDAPFKVVEQKPVRKAFGFSSGCVGGQCVVKK